MIVTLISWLKQCLGEFLTINSLPLQLLYFLGVSTRNLEEKLLGYLDKSKKWYHYYYYKESMFSELVVSISRLSWQISSNSDIIALWRLIQPPLIFDGRCDIAHMHLLYRRSPWSLTPRPVSPLFLSLSQMSLPLSLYISFFSGFCHIRENYKQKPLKNLLWLCDCLCSNHPFCILLS